MNERIRELAIQAGFEFWQDEPWNIDWSSRYDASYDDEFIKFAELLIQDAAAAEREAIAQMFDGKVWAYDYRCIAERIRARGMRND